MPASQSTAASSGVSPSPGIWRNAPFTATASQGGKTASTGERQDIFSGTATMSAVKTAARVADLQEKAATRALQAEAVKAAGTVEARLQEMKKDMATIVNSYPPFLRGSEKRRQYLMSISSIRQQIEAMTIPPDKAAEGQAAQAKTNALWHDLFKGVSAPELATGGPSEASNETLRNAYTAVEQMRAGLAERRTALERQVMPAAAVSQQIPSSAARYLSQTAGQVLAQAGFSLTTNLTGGLKGL